MAIQILQAKEAWREFAIRLALGASRGRLIRQWLVESLMLAAVSGAMAWRFAR